MSITKDLSADDIQEILIWSLVKLAARFPDGLSRIEASIEAVALTLEDPELAAELAARPNLKLVKGAKGGSRST